MPALLHSTAHKEGFAPKRQTSVVLRNKRITMNCIYTWFFENRATKKCQSLALIVNLMALVT